MRALDTFVDNILAAIANIPLPFAVGSIATVNTGTTPATVTVHWRGATVPAKFPRGLTAPTVGHTVLMARVGPQLLIVHTY